MFEGAYGGVADCLVGGVGGGRRVAGRGRASWGRVWCVGLWTEFGLYLRGIM